MKRVVFSLVVLGFLAASCQDRFRYSCQDPKNHMNAECTPPECEADGTCTKYLLKDGNEN